MSDSSLRLEHVLPSGTVTFLFTDIEGSTRLWEEQPDAMSLALARHDALLHNAIEINSGVVIKSRGEGDSFFAVFARATDAVAVACAIQRALMEEQPQGLRLQVRIALHTGEADLRDGDYYGAAVNRCARLRAVAHGGQTLLSLATQELVRDALPAGASLKDLGSHRLRDLQRPEQVFQLLHPDLPADFPPLKSLTTLPNNLPQQLTSFVGREKEMAEVKSLLQKTRLLTLTGAGGCGKTRLSLQVAADLLQGDGDGVWLVELAPLSDPSLVPQAVATVLGVREAAGRPILQTLTDYLKSKRLLLILDNCEHLLSACAQLSETLLRFCPQLTILASSREGLGIAGEQTYRVPSLSSPDPKEWSMVNGQWSMSKAASSIIDHQPLTITQYEAVRLFIDRAVSVQPSFNVTNQNAPAVAQVCHRLDGIPLAIELAAARVRVLKVEEIAARLDDRFRLLTGGSRTALLRQQTLQAAIDWSYDLLTEQERTLLRRLAVFAGGWTLPAVESVGAGEGIEDWDVLDLLTQLVDKSLVMVEEGDGGGSRYRLLETVRQYARERLLESGETAALRERHRNWFLALAEEAKPQLEGPQQVAWFARLEMEHGNLRQALQWCVEESRERTPCCPAEAGLRLTAALFRFWEVRGYWREGRERIEALLALPEASAHTAARADALYTAGCMAHMQGDIAAMLAFHKESLAISRETGNPQGIARALNGLGMAAESQGDYTAARAHFEQALDIYREQGNRVREAIVLLNLSLPTFRQSDYAAARAFGEQALALSREIGHRHVEALALYVLGLVASAQGDYPDASGLYEQALAIHRALGSRVWEAENLAELGTVALRQGDFAAARALYEGYLSLSRELGSKDRIGNALVWLGSVALYQGERERAKSLGAESLALCREIGHKAGFAACLHLMGRVAYHEGDAATARARLGESLTMRREMGNKLGIAESLENMAELAQTEGQTERTARLWGAAESLREAIGAPLPPVDRADYERNIAAVRAALGEEVFAAAWSEGRKMTVEEAIAYALNEGEQP